MLVIHMQRAVVRLSGGFCLRQHGVISICRAVRPGVLALIQANLRVRVQGA